MKSIGPYDKRVWRWWVTSDIISNSHDMIQIKSQKDDSGPEFCVDVHKELLCFYSPYYTAAIKGEFCESRQECFTLELDYRQAQVFVEWLYTGRIDVEFWKGNENDDIHALYVFADQTDILALRRSIMTALVGSGRDPPTPSSMARLVSQLPDKSGLRLFLLEEAQAEWRLDDSDEPVTEQDWKSRGYVPEDYPADFYDQLVHGEYNASLPSLGGCDYHEHDDEEEWSMTCAVRFIPRDVPAPRAECYKNSSS